MSSAREAREQELVGRAGHSLGEPCRDLGRPCILGGSYGAYCSPPCGGWEMWFSGRG